MSNNRSKATEPSQLGSLFLERFNAGDVEGLVELYEMDAVLALPGDAGTAVGHPAIKDAYTQATAAGLKLSGGRQRPTLIHGDIALTATTFSGGPVTAEVARRQDDGSWLWIADNPYLAP